MKHTIEGTVTFMRGRADEQACVCCPPASGHIFNRSVKWDEWVTNYARYFGNGPNVLLASKVTDINENEGHRVRVTVELLPLEEVPPPV